MTPQLMRVLRVFLADPTQERYGYDLMKAAKLASGTLYPMLARMEEEGIVSSAWEEAPQRQGQPRKYYVLTGEGARIARMEVAEASLNAGSSARRARRVVPGQAR